MRNVLFFLPLALAILALLVVLNNTGTLRYLVGLLA